MFYYQFLFLPQNICRLRSVGSQRKAQQVITNKNGTTTKTENSYLRDMLMLCVMYVCETRPCEIATHV